jgi:hypothetical protein
LFYANGYDHGDGTLSVTYGGHQFNGRCNGCTWQRNISHTNSGWGFSLIQGVHNSTIQNNLLFNNGTYGIIMQIYPGSCRFTGSGDSDICPYDTNNNLFANNTIWVGTARGDGYSGLGNNPQLFAGIGIARNTTQCVEGGVSVAGTNCTMEQTFRNNVIVTSMGPSWRFMQDSGDQWAENSVFENNVVYRTAGSDRVLFKYRDASEVAYSFPSFQASFIGGPSNSFANPLFVRANTAEYSQPNSFRFDLQSSSPAIGFGRSTGAPTHDLRGLTRTLPYDAGAFEYQGGSPAPAPSPTVTSSPTPAPSPSPAPQPSPSVVPGANIV